MVRYIRHEFGRTSAGVHTGRRSNWIISRLKEVVPFQIPSPESTNCNSNEQSQVATAVTGSKAETKNAFNCMSQRTCDSTAVRWFGLYNRANFEYSTGMFNRVNNRLVNYAFNAYCNPSGCGNNVYGYVYPTDPAYTVYLCGAFWRLPGERVNTVVHEMSHFRALGDTQDYAYGQPACLNLARSDPFRATHNADNVCYFTAEVSLATPALADF